jgi:hypothetical protein
MPDLPSEIKITNKSIEKSISVIFESPEKVSYGIDRQMTNIEPGDTVNMKVDVWR